MSKLSKNEIQNISNVNHAERNVSFVTNHWNRLFDSHGLYQRMGSTDVPGKGYFLAEAKEDGNRGSRSSTSCLMCIAARAEQKAHEHTARHCPPPIDRPRLGLLSWCLPPARPPARFLFRRWVERSGHACMVLATPYYMFIIIVCG